MSKRPSKRTDLQLDSRSHDEGKRTPPAADDQPSSSNPNRPGSGDAQPLLEPPLTIAEVARHYRMSERTVRRRIKDGTLQKEPGLGRLVRISVEQLRRLPLKIE
jgi:AraC-like DNA-binding protein